MTPIYTMILRQVLQFLPLEVERQSDSSVVDLGPLSDLRWKGQGLDAAKHLQEHLGSIAGIQIDDQQLKVTDQCSAQNFFRFKKSLENWVDLIAKDNLLLEKSWALPVGATPQGFEEKDASTSHQRLEELYQDQSIVKEKKPLVLDMRKAWGSYLVGIEPEQSVILDGASQIASASLGFNHPLKNAMSLRPEIHQLEGTTKGAALERWDVYQAFCHLMKKETGLPHVYLVNSGSEAIETALRGCQLKYPNRRKIVAFEGSFHGRSALAIHCTYSPAKREPFEFKKDMVEFMPFPFTLDADADDRDPSQWLNLWSITDSSDFKAQLEKLDQSSELLKSEIESLQKIRQTLDVDHDSRPLAVLIEPMQCEGGDRYGTSRFFRALRVLTRAFDTPLVFDEVQTGLGLGGSFFWHQSFELATPNGERDYPDAVATAKKTQVGVVISQIEQDLPFETSRASIYRGYLQAAAIQSCDFEKIESLIKTHLDIFVELLGTELIGSARSKGLAFAFDLPDPKILQALISHRFPNGLMFYPAGTQTARFRVLASVQEEEIYLLFRCLYRCFLDAKRADEIKASVPDESEWEKRAPRPENLSDKKGLQTQIPWKPEWIPSSRDEYMNLSASDWNQLFLSIARNFPQMIYHPVSYDLDINSLSQLSKGELWDRYQNDAEFTMLDLLWCGSRVYSYDIRRLTQDQVKEHAQTIADLEEAAFEPERRDDPHVYFEIAKNPRSITLACLDKHSGKDRIIGMCIAAPAALFKSYKLVAEDPLVDESSTFYSRDLSVHPDFQGRGMGYRLKIEQLIAARRDHVHVIRSRNRYPEAEAMLNLNHKLASVVIGQNDQTYGGEGTALYQSITLPTSQDSPDRFKAVESLQSLVKNKVTLSNFVSESFITNLSLFKSVLPESMRRLYIASGRCEAVDKAFKLLVHHRPQAKYCLSFAGDTFGTHTACARSLGGDGKLNFFGWPLMQLPSESISLQEQIQSIQSQLDEHSPEDVFGLFVEPMSEQTKKKKSPEFLKRLLGLCRKRKIPVIFQETASAFYKYLPDRFFCASDDIQPDGICFYPGGQLGLVATRDNIYLNKPLMMISTWDGDEFSLGLLQEKILNSSPDQATH